MAKKTETGRYLKYSALKYLQTTSSSQRQFINSLFKIVLIETLVFVMIFSLFLVGRYQDKVALEKTILQIGISRNFFTLNSWSKENVSFNDDIGFKVVLRDFLENPTNNYLRNKAQKALNDSSKFARGNFYKALVLIDQEGKHRGKLLNFRGYHFPINSSATIIAKATKTVFDSRVLGLDVSRLAGLNKLLYIDPNTSFSTIDYFIPGDDAYFLNYHSITNSTGDKVIGAIINFSPISDFSANFVNSYKGLTGELFIISYNGVILSHPYSYRRVLTPISTKDSLPSLEDIRRTDKIKIFKNFEGHRYIYYSELHNLQDGLINFEPKSFYFVFRQKASEVLSVVFWDITKNALMLFSVLLSSTIIIFITIFNFLKELHFADAKVKVASYQLTQNMVSDPLTGLYNRFYFDELHRKLLNNHSKISIILCDIDGLKLMNDAFGHLEGDLLINRARQVLKGSVPFAPIARIGGDEFVIILQDLSMSDACRYKQSIIENTKYFNSSNSNQILPLSISLGVSSGLGSDGLYDLVKKADRDLYLDKSCRSSNLRKDLLSILLSYLQDMKPIHNNREGILETLCCTIGSFFPSGTIKNNDLNLLIHYYDLGRVTKLSMGNDEDSGEYHQAGYRIAMYLPEISGIADLILKQNENYDGSGELGLQGEFIPIECRIFRACRFFDDKYLEGGLDFASKSIGSLSSKDFDPVVIEFIGRVARSIYGKFK